MKKRLMFFGILAVLLLVFAAFSEYLTPYDPYAQDLSIANEEPSVQHLLGTDRYGRDMLSRVMTGSRASIYSALVLVIIITFAGTIIGIICALSGRMADTIIMRIADIFLAFPGLVAALAIAAVLGGGLYNAVIALAVVSWPKYACLARSQTLALKKKTFIEAAKLSGTGTLKMITNHILPNIIGPILVTAVLDIGTMIMELAGLSFLGLGAKPPTAEWGSMMSDSRSMLATSPWIVLSPGVAIFMSVMIFNLFGDTLRDYVDPKLRNE